MWLGISFDWVHLLAIVDFPKGELSNPWVRADLATLRRTCILLATVVIIATTAVWKCPTVIDALCGKIGTLRSAAAASPLFVPLCLTSLILMKTVLQLGLYALGYAAYGADDFSRSLNADYWLYYRRFDLGWEGWLGLGESGWLPFSDYLFAIGLAIYRDLYLTPRVVNLVISGIGVVTVYCLGRELFGRREGLVAAVLFAFQPWPVWLGISGMTSDLPSVVLIVLFGIFLVRWLRTETAGTFLTAAAMLAIGNGFRYENWFFAVVFSLLIIFQAASDWKQGNFTRRKASVAVSGLALINAFPLAWMIASYMVLGDWLPALNVTNSWMVAGMTPSQSVFPSGVPLATNQAPLMAHMNMLVLGLGAFPMEIALSVGGMFLFLKQRGEERVRWYLVVLIGALLLFIIVFKGRLSASIFFARFFLPFVVLALPYAGLLLIRLAESLRLEREGIWVTMCSIIAVVAGLDLGRAFNYPAMFPKDAISAGWTIRNLQQTGTIAEGEKILIERSADWGDLAIVALANRPERFVLLNELAYQGLSGLGRSDRPALKASANGEGVRGTICNNGFQEQACKESVLREKFGLVILSSPSRVASFQKSFGVRSWTVGRYHIFDMRSLAERANATREHFS